VVNTNRIGDRGTPTFDVMVHPSRVRARPYPALLPAATSKARDTPGVRHAGGLDRHPYTRGTVPKKIQIRPPGLKPTTKVGTLGPYRGRLGLAWVIAPLIAGLVIAGAAYFALFR
jgi:hypothetical protein